MNLFRDFLGAKNKKSEAKKFGNVIHSPILCDNINHETPLILLLLPPELHLLIRPVNKMYAVLESLWPDSKNSLKLCNVKNKIIMLVALLAMKVDNYWKVSKYQLFRNTFTSIIMHEGHK